MGIGLESLRTLEGRTCTFIGEKVQGYFRVSPWVAYGLGYQRIALFKPFSLQFSTIVYFLSLILSVLFSEPELLVQTPVRN